MILNPGILALLLGAAIALLMILFAAWLGIKILARWDPASSSEQQLLLERQSWLVASLVNYALGFQIAAGLLFVYTLEDIHRLFIGAMCATGALNANQIGWAALLVKLVCFFAAALWVVFNRLDQSSETTPLVRPKYLALLLLVPLLSLDLYLQYRYFSGLQPEIITSCCASLFSLGNASVASELAGLPVAPTMLAFYLVAGGQLLLLLLCLRYPAALLRQLLFAGSLLLLFVGLISVVAFISPYIYQLPSHHCPFDMLQENYHFIGYPLYLGLFVATLFGVLPGLCQPLQKQPALKNEIRRRERHWLWFSLLGTLTFVIISSWPILFGTFIYLGY